MTNAIPVTIARLGDSASISVPKPVAQLLGLRAGTWVHVRLVPGGKTFKKQLMPRNVDRVCVIIPKTVLVDQGLKLGDVIDVPFNDWKLAEPPSVVKRTKKAPRKATR